MHYGNFHLEMDDNFYVIFTSKVCKNFHLKPCNLYFKMGDISFLKLT